MKDLITVASFTIKDMIKRKSFIISMIIILVLIVVGFNIPNILNKVKGDSELGTSKILLVDNENIFEGTLNSLNQEDSLYKFDVLSENIDNEQIKEKVKNGEYDCSLIFTKTETGVTIEYIVESVVSFGEIPKEVLESFNILYTNVQIAKLDLSLEELQSLSTNFEVKITETDENAASGNSLVTMLLSLALFMGIHFFAYQVSSSITTEKTSRIMETLITSTNPKTIVVGKTIGAGVVGLLQILTIGTTAVISAIVFLPEGDIEGILDISNITPMFAILTVAYFILGYFLFAFLYALTGSTVSKPEDINSANSPIAFIEVAGFYLAYFAMINPSSKINILASILPISSPFSMPFRMMLGTATASQIITSVIVLIITIILIAKISIKIYSSAILNYGTKLNFKDMLKIYKNKN